MKTLRLPLLAVCAVLAFAPTVNAQYSLYRSTNAFFTALSSSNYATETFSALPPTVPSPSGFTNGSYAFQVSIPGSANLSPEAYQGKPALSTFFTAQSLVFTNFSANTRAFGAYLYGNNLGLVVSQPLTISLLLSTGPSNVFTTNIGTTSLTDYFFGFIADDPLTIQSLTLSITNEQAFPTVSEVTISTVPEPSTYAMLGLAAAALAGHLIRRRRS